MKYALLVLALTSLGFSSPQPLLRLTVIAPSVSTSMESRRIISASPGWRHVHLREAEAVLVVVRSILPFPLQSSYQGLCELRADAEAQLNIAGPNFHVYVYALDDDFSPRQTKHVVYEAR